MTDHGTLHLATPGDTGLRFEARFASGRTTTFDSGADAAAPNPVEHLIASLAACEAMDVVSILRKQRSVVTAYEVGMAGERAAAAPRRFTAIELTHRLSGPALSAEAVERALELSRTRYCSVLHTLDPGLRLTQRVEVREG